MAPKAYPVGIICVLPLDLLAVRKHKVVAACLPDGEYGTNSAADVAANMGRTFPSVKLALLVGIGGGVPSLANDIRLGDVVVSRPTGTSPGIIQDEMGKVLENRGFTQVGSLQPLPRLIMTAPSNLRSDPYLSATRRDCGLSTRISIPRKDLDRLFTSDYSHDPQHATCDNCDLARLQARSPRPSDKNNGHHPHIHYDTIASGNRVVRDAKFRDHWGTRSNILCFEMEAAGIMNTLSCLVIRGICDYSGQPQE
ncbi:nucleoside phosphorylase domain-containing protein [Aspergillus granulosus]|uniref:Nucleoside phosphorylase domain-containing protein n=1 Tax=Aspergillus granulosus TaxID=176169 RepID=A0ABR4H5W7_9EURO